MKSVKPGRGPSMMGAVTSAVFMLFGVVWVVATSQFLEGAGSLGFVFPLFGVLFVVIAAVQFFINLHNATGKNRYSEFDITDGQEEPDPLAERFESASPGDTPSSTPSYCPFCGTELGKDYAYCPRCGKKLPT